MILELTLIFARLSPPRVHACTEQDPNWCRDPVPLEQCGGRELRRWQPGVELELHHLLSVNQVEAILSGRLDAGFAASLTPWHKDLAHWEFAQERMVLAVPKGHALT